VDEPPPLAPPADEPEPRQEEVADASDSLQERRGPRAEAPPAAVEPEPDPEPEPPAALHGIPRTTCRR